MTAEREPMASRAPGAPGRKLACASTVLLFWRARRASSAQEQPKSAIPGGLLAAGVFVCVSDRKPAPPVSIGHERGEIPET